LLACAPVSGTPSGAIAAFTGGCPSGWNAAIDFAGRVLVGSGGGYAAGETGGADYQTLSEAQMPSHSHKVVTGDNSGDWELQSNTSGTVRAWSNTGGDTEYSLNGTTGPADRGNSSSVGDGQAFDNRQAYSVVNFCKKN
jgi:microcystin-dependent protein